MPPLPAVTCAVPVYIIFCPTCARTRGRYVCVVHVVLYHHYLCTTPVRLIIRCGGGVVKRALFSYLLFCRVVKISGSFACDLSMNKCPGGYRRVYNIHVTARGRASRRGTGKKDGRWKKKIIIIKTLLKRARAIVK